MRVLGFGTYDTARHPRVRVLLDGLVEHGAQVRECAVPLGLSTAERVRMLQQPWRLPLLVLRLLRTWATLVVRSTAARRAGRPDVVLVGYLGHFDVLLARCLFPRTTVVLDHLVFAGDTARDRGAGGGWRGRVLGLLDRAALRAADVVVVDTDEHAAMVPPALRGRVVVAPVGADRSWTDAAGATAAEQADRADGASLSVVFFGLMTPLQGAPVIAEALRRTEGRVRATVVGSGQDSARVDALLDGVPGVTRLAWVAPAELPHLVARHDVCLGIFGDAPKSLRVVPNKVYQGAAAGCVVLTSDTAPQRRALDEDAVLVPPADAAALAAALEALAADPRRVAALRASAAERARTSFTPAAVTAALAARLRGTD